MARPRTKRSRGAAIALRNIRRRTGGVKAVEPRVAKAIPNADRHFAGKIEAFAASLARDPERYNITVSDSQMLTRRAKEFRAALLLAVGKGTRTATTIMDKDAARKTAEELLRGIRNQIRWDGTIEQRDKTELGLTERPKKLGKRVCPKSPPVLRYLCGIDAEGSAPGQHVLEFRELHSQGTAMKPAGAASLHLYFDFVPPGEPVPALPNERGWPKFLREYTRTPFQVRFPVPMSGPMLLVYWGCWSDGKGNTGPWSKPCEARVEGWTANAALPAADAGTALEARRMREVETKFVFVQAPYQLPDHLAGDVVSAEIAALSRNVHDAAMPKMLNAA